MARLSEGDVLSAARARDRLLERLFNNNGLRPEQDLPDFLRSSGLPTHRRFHAIREWMLELHRKAVRWCGEVSPQQTPVSKQATPAYVDLFFAFGFELLGETEQSTNLITQALRALQTVPKSQEAHQAVSRALCYRIEQIRQKKPREEKTFLQLLEIPESVLQDQDKNGTTQRYYVERSRSSFRILEPHRRIDPYRRYLAHNNEIDQELNVISDLSDREEIDKRLRSLLTQSKSDKEPVSARARILKTALDKAPLIHEEFAVEMLLLTIKTYDQLAGNFSTTTIEQQSYLLERGLFLAAHFDRREIVEQLVIRFQRLIRSLEASREGMKHLAEVVGQCLGGLRKLGMRDRIDVLLQEMALTILEGNEIEDLDFLQRNEGIEELTALLHVAGGWLHYGQTKQAETIINQARKVLFHPKLSAIKLGNLARVYARTVGQLSPELAQERLEEIFARIKTIKDSRTPNSFYGYVQLIIVESIVLGIVNEETQIGSDAQRWLDEDEFLVRRRIHQELRELMGTS